jgi:uncharacterized damage-inducible protein DinB
MEELRAYRKRLLEQADGQLARLRGQVSAIGPGEGHSPLESGGWSAHQILVHMRDVEQQAFLPRIQSMLRENDPELPYFDEGAWMEQHYDREESFESLLDSFESARRELLDELISSAPGGWTRAGRHPTQGVRTVQWWFEYSVQHTEEHLRQLAGK